MMMMMMMMIFILVASIVVIWTDGLGGWVDLPGSNEAKEGNAEVVASLLRAGADKDQLTSKGRSALQLARSADLYGSHLQAVGLCGSVVHDTDMQTYRPTDT